MEDSQVRCTCIAGRTGRTILGRLQRHTDLVSGLIHLCRISDIRTAGIVSLAGALQKATFAWAIPSTRTKRGSERCELVTVEGPLEFLAGDGVIGLVDPENPAVQLHATVVDKTGRVWGGHFSVGGNPVHSTMDVVLVELLDADFGWIYDDEMGFSLPVAKEKNNGVVVP